MLTLLRRMVVHEAKYRFALVLIALAVLANGTGVANGSAAAPPSPPSTQVRHSDLLGRLKQAKELSVQRERGAELLKQVDPTVRLARTFLEMNDMRNAGEAFRYASNMAMFGGDLRRSLLLVEEAAAACGRAGDQECMAKALANAGATRLRLKDPYGAIRRLREAAAAGERAGQTHLSWTARFNAAAVRWDIGDLEGAIADYQELSARVPPEHEGSRSSLLSSLSDALFEAGKLPEARAVAEQARTAATATAPSEVMDSVSQSRKANLSLARVAAAQGDGAIALALYEDTLASEAGMPEDERFGVHASHAEALHLLGRPAEAQAAMTRALQFRGAALAVQLQRTLDLASTIAERNGDYESALGFAREAQAIRGERSAIQLRSLVSDSAAQIGLVQQRAALAEAAARSERERADQERRLGRLRLVGAISFAGLVLVGLVVFAAFRTSQLKRRQEEVLAERTRIAGEMHDTLMQSVTGVVQRLQFARRSIGSTSEDAVRNLEQAETAARVALADARLAVWDMRDSGPAAVRLGERLRAAVSELSPIGSASVAVRLTPENLVASPQTADALVRIACEALANALRHGAPSQVDLSAEKDGERFRLVVADNGRGFLLRPEEAAQGGHWGLLGMTERAARLGGRVQIESTPGSGTRIVAELPA